VKAEQYLAKAIEHSPNSASSLFQMAQLKYAQGDYVKSAEQLKRYELVTRQFQAEMMALAYKVQLALNNRSAADNYAGMLVKMFPRSPETKQFIANGLANIAADDLAVKYKLSQQTANIESLEETEPAKKVVKLSPNKTMQVVPVESKPVLKPEVQTSTDVVTEKLVAPLPQQPKEQEEVAPPIENTESESQKSTQQGLSVTIPVHIIEKGDSLFTVSQKYNVTMKALKRWNKLADINKIRLGQMIYLADPKKVAENQ
jgi:type IV pilus assembly protein PilF